MESNPSLWKFKPNNKKNKKQELYNGENPNLWKLKTYNNNHSNYNKNHNCNKNHNK